MPERELERLRDDNLVAMMRALKRTGTGAGGVINTHEATLAMPQPVELPVTVSRSPDHRPQCGSFDPPARDKGARTLSRRPRNGAELSRRL